MAMSENEAIERLKCMRLFMEINDRQNESKFLEDDYVANSMAIQALEEIQKIKEIISDFPLDCGSPVEDVREIYRQLRGFLQIGTVEEFKALKEKNEAKKPIDKSKNPTDWHVMACPCCENVFWNSGQFVRYQPKFCNYCGQKLDWSE